MFFTLRKSSSSGLSKNEMVDEFSSNTEALVTLKLLAEKRKKQGYNVSVLSERKIKVSAKNMESVDYYWVEKKAA